MGTSSTPAMLADNNSSLPPVGCVPAHTENGRFGNTSNRPRGHRGRKRCLEHMDVQGFCQMRNVTVQYVICVVHLKIPNFSTCEEPDDR